jgi:hypothetical protein
VQPGSPLFLVCGPLLWFLCSSSLFLRCYAFGLFFPDRNGFVFFLCGGTRSPDVSRLYEFWLVGKEDARILLGSFASSEPFSC